MRCSWKFCGFSCSFSIYFTEIIWKSVACTLEMLSCFVLLLWHLGVGIGSKMTFPINLLLEIYFRIHYRKNDELRWHIPSDFRRGCGIFCFFLYHLENWTGKCHVSHFSRIMQVIMVIILHYLILF